MSTVLDYADRLADVAAFQGMFPAAGEQLLVQELVRDNDGGSLVAGVEKLAQNFVMALCTKRNSKQYRPGDGCQFLADAERGLWRTVADVTQSFYLSRVDVARQLLADELTTDPVDERYGTADLVGVTLVADRVTAGIRLSSLAGTTYTFLTPIQVPLR